jgi:hypothetical protein
MLNFDAPTGTLPHLTGEMLKLRAAAVRVAGVRLG